MKTIHWRVFKGCRRSAS